MDSEAILVVIAECAREVMPALETHRFSRSDQLAELGADSVDRAEIVTMVLERIALKISRTEVFGPRNIGELAELLHQKLRA
jgi:polyketide biosynthesis acyl carrier protein